MKKLTLLFLCLFGISMSYAEEVNIGLELSKADGCLILPGHLFLDNKPLLDLTNCYSSYDSDYPNSSDANIIIYDCDFTSSTIHFNCDKVVKAYLRDVRLVAEEGYKYPLSQCFFNNDALYECFTYDVKTDSEGERLKVNFRIVNQNGDILYTFEMPDGYENDKGEYILKSPYIEFNKVSDNHIIAIFGFYQYSKSEDYMGYYECYYSLKVGQMGSLASIKHKREMRLEANPVTKGTDLIVMVGEDVQQSPIIVTTLSGVAVKEVPVVDGKAVISTSDLSYGMYIASQNGGASAKFIVK